MHGTIISFTRRHFVPSRSSIVLAACLLLLVPRVQAQTALGNAISFNGTNQYVNIPNFGNIIPTNEITVEFWANTSLATGQSAFILNPDDGNNRFNAHLNYGTSPPQGLTYWDFGNISGPGRLGPINAPVNSVGTWVHYAFVASQSSNSMSIYTNGTLMATKAGMTPFVRGAYDLHIGGSSNYFTYSGSIDDFRVWNVARTQTQIQSDLTTPLTGNEAGLVAYYRFDSASGTVATNSATATGAAYNGTLMNTPTWVPSGAAAQVVTTTANTGPGSLRQAISSVLPGGYVVFTNSLSGGTITLSSEIAINTNLTIDATGLQGGITLSGNNATRIFNINSGSTVSMHGLTFTGGNGSGSADTGSGGAIRIVGKLALTGCTFTGNNAAFGGALFNNHGTATLVQCTLTGNSAEDAGAIANARGTLAMTSCTLALNNAADSANVSGGGAIDSYISASAVTMTNCIIAGNTSASGNGPELWLEDGSLMAVNCLIGNGADSTLTNGVNGNLVGSGAAPINALLAPLGNYGGSPQTMPPTAGSPAIDAGSDAVTNVVTTDERGFPRLSGAHVDIGAVEVNSNSLVTTVADAGPGSLRYALAAVASGDLISFAQSLSGQTIALTNGQIELGNSVSIDSSGLGNAIQISGNGQNPIFQIDPGVTVKLNSLTIARGYSTSGASGGIQNFGNLAMNRCTMVGNTNSYSNSGGQGGAIYNARGVLAATNCTFTANYAGFTGGAIFNNVPNPGAQVLCTLVHCTLAGNIAGYIGDGIDNNGTVTIIDTIIANNNVLDFDNYAGTVVRQGANIVGTFADNAGGTDSGPAAITSNPLVAALGNYGGPTQTMPPLGGSPAINAGVTVTGLAIDQRGAPRLRGAAVDIGAVEVNPATIVTTNSDSGPGSLRVVAAGVTNGDVVSFAANLAGQTIVITNGGIELSNNVAIDGAGLPGGVQISGGGISRIFNIESNANVTLITLTLRNANGGGADGGAIQNAGAAVINNCTFTNNSTGSGGAILNIVPGAMTLNNCTLTGNSGAPAGAGGGIVNRSMLAINNSTFAANTSGGGAAVYNDGTGVLTLTNSTFIGNSVGSSGGALISVGELTAVQCTFAGNSAANGGAVFAAGTGGTLIACTLALNNSTTPDPSGGGGAIYDAASSLVLFNCLLAGNVSASGQGPNILTNGNTVTAISTLVGDGSGSGLTNGVAGNLVGTSASPINAHLATLGNYGGPTQTMPPLPGSPAINAGAPLALATDQRGFLRSAGGANDIGSVELQTPFTEVITNADDGSDGTLRSVLAQQVDIGTTITFDPSLSGQTITLTNGEIAVNNNFYVIDGSALANGVQISGNNSTRLFNIGSGGNLTLNSLTLRNGHGGGGDGGAILNVGTAALNACTLTANATGSGGAIVNNQPGAMALNNCTLTGNSSALGGGGGAIVNRALLVINNCTLANNQSPHGNAIYDDSTGILDVTNSILVGGPDASISQLGTVNSGFDVIDPANINLAPLGNYGGPTQTMPPLPGSPAIDAGLDSVTSFLATDQRGKPRLIGAHVDAGAVEGIYSTAGPGRLTGLSRLADGSIKLTFTNFTDQQFVTLASTNLALPESKWTQIGAVIESPAGSGQFQFTDPQAAGNYPRRFYRVKTP